MSGVKILKFFFVNKKMKLILVLSAVLSIALSHPYKSSGGHGGHEVIGKIQNKNKISAITKELNLEILKKKTRRLLHNSEKKLIIKIS